MPCLFHPELQCSRATDTLPPIEDSVIRGGTFAPENLRGPTLTVSSRGMTDRN
jgi:hypothetical protein